MSTSIWSSPATRIIGKAKKHGMLYLNDDEFVFVHALTSEILPINVLSVSVTEQITRIPGSISLIKHNLLRIDDRESDSASCFIIKVGTAEILNQHLDRLRFEKLKLIQSLQSLAEKEEREFTESRVQARQKRQAFRESLQHEKRANCPKLTETKLSQSHSTEARTLITEQTSAFSKDEQVSRERMIFPPANVPQPIEKDFTAAEKNSLIQEMVNYLTLRILFLEQSEKRESIQNCTAFPIPDYNEESNVRKKKKLFVRDVIYCLELRALALEKMESRLFDTEIPYTDIARVAVIILGINPYHQPKLQLYNRLRKQFGNDQGSEYYYQTVGLLSSR